MDTKAQVALANLKAPFKKATFLAEFIGLDVRPSRAGRNQIVARLAAVGSNDKPMFGQDYTTTFYVPTITENDDNPKLLAEAKKKGSQLFQADDEFPRRPEPAGRGMRKLASGEVVPFKDAQAAEMAVDIAVLEKLKAIQSAADVGYLEGKRVYVRMGEARWDADYGSSSQFINELTLSLRPGEALLSPADGLLDYDKQAEFAKTVTGS